ncbi:hypothetical protein IKF15_00280 [Candidatus Saccharibacteria bacterium]|nr:hypothetical protein [Candidatus Saccharibacteria bacterium]
MNKDTKFEVLEKFVLSIGLNDKDTKTQIIDTKKAQEIIEGLLIVEGFEGASIFEGLGLYKHNQNGGGVYVHEKTLKVELLFTTLESVLSLCNAVKRALNQESVAIERVQSFSALI